MDDDGAPHRHSDGLRSPELQSSFLGHASAAAAAAGAMLVGGGGDGDPLEGAKAMARDLDECDVWDGVEGKEEEMAPMEGEEEDLVLDMLRSQQDGHFIIGGESVIGDADMVSDFVAGEVGGRVEMGGGGGFADGSEESMPSSDAAGNGKASHAVSAEVRSGDGGEAVAICEKGTGEEIGNESKAPQVDKRTWAVGAASDRGMGEVKFEEGERGKEEEGKIEEGLRRKEEEEEGKIEEGGRGVDEGMIGEGDQGKEEEGKIEEGERGVNEGRIEEVERGVEEGMVEEGERGVEEGMVEEGERGVGEVKVAEREKGVQEGKVEKCEGEVTEGKSEEGKQGVEEGKSEEVKAIEVEGVGGEAKALDVPVKMDMDVVSTCDGDDSGMKGGQEGDRGGGGDAIKKKEGGEEEVGSKLQSAVAANSEVPAPVSSFPQVGKEVVGEDVGVELVVKHESRGVEMDGFEPPDAAKATDVMEKAGVVVQMDDAQLLDATMAAIGETGENKDISLSALSTGVGGAAAEASQVVLNVNEELGSSGNASTRGPGRKKRGRQPKVQVPRVSKKKAEEDVCFICFDGGDLVVCDRRGCPKVYHPSCINRDEAFFKARGRWNCGWHICSICEKVAHHMCYTCTYSLCKGCIKQSKFFCIRGNKGLCETCKGMVMLIETNDPVNKTAAANFYDKNNWECLFKDYWMDVKQKLSLTFEEITKGKKSSKKAMARNEESSDEVYEAHEGASSSDSSSGRGSSTRKKAKRRQPVAPNEESSVTVADSEGSSFPGNNEWASKELLEFVSHMKDGETTVLSQFDVQALLLEYIKRNNLRDPRRKSQIICDSRLENLFGKTRVGHFEMLKLLESHFLMKETSNFAPDDDRMTNGEPDSNRADAEGSSEAVKMIADRRRKSRKKESREPQTNFDDYAAIDVHNISLIYLRRNLMEEQLDDAENFNEKAVGSFVRIKIPATSPRQDTYRLVKVIGTTKAAEKYQAGKRMTEITLEILNLNKTEVISIDTISNQDFTEEECKRLRQSIKYGFIPRMTVGELQEKARNLQSIKVNDWLEVEKARLGHLRDRASETGRRKELRECVEKLELLPEEHARRLNDIPEVHSDSNMDPNYESAEEEPEDGRRDNMPRQRGHDYYRKGKETRAFEKDFTPTESWSGAKRGVVASLEQRNSSEMVMDSTDTMHNLSWSRGKDMPQHNNLESQNTRGTTSILQNIVQSSEEAGQLHSSVNASLSTPSSSTGAPAARSPSINESDKMWCYQDPTGKIQGPFSMLQLRKWNSTGYFPRDLRIWKTSQRQDDSILLTDALIGKFVKELPAWGSRQGSVSLSPGSASMVDSRDKRDGWRGSNDFSTWTDKKFGVQEHGGTWTSGKPAAFQSNGSNHGRQTPTKGSSSFQKFPSQEANVQNMASSFGSNAGLVPNSANRNSPTTFGSSISGSARGNQPRVRVSRWEPEPGATFVHGQSGAEIPPKMDTSGASGGAASTPLSMTSPMPKNEQFRNIASAVPGSNSNAPLAKNIGLSSQDKTNTEAIAGNSELPQINSFSEDMQKNYSPIRTEGNGAVHQVRGAAGGVKQSTSETIVSGPQPSSSGNWVASADAKNAEWSMPSPTPTSEVGRVGVGAQSSQRNNPPAFSDSSRHVPFSEMRPNSSVGSAPQPIQQQPQGPMGSQNSGWGFASENPAMNAMPTQAAGGWSAALPANANVAWVAPGASNVGWSAIPQGNANVVGWVPTAAGASIVNPASQVAGPGTMNPVAGWGTVAQVPQANANWGTAVQQGNVNTGWGTPVQGFPNSNPGWVVPQPANADQNVGWGSQLSGNPNANVGWGTPNGNSNAGWNSPAGNQNSRGPHQREQKDRYNRNANNGDSGHGGGRHRTHSGGGSSRDPQGGPRGICRFHENGYCRRGASCNYLHT